jgi:hypothetical protein
MPSETTRIIAPRVAFLDDRTGLISREWYRFFLNLFTEAGTNSTDISGIEVAPSTAAIEARYDALITEFQGSLLDPSSEAVSTASSAAWMQMTALLDVAPLGGNGVIFEPSFQVTSLQPTFMLMGG